MYVLTSLIEDYKSIIIAKKHLQNLEERLHDEKLRLHKLKTILDKEYDDIHEFESMPIRKLFGKILINKKEQYEIEKQEYLLAALRYNECLKLIELMTYEKEILRGKVSSETEIYTRLNKQVEKEKLELDKRFPIIKEKLNLINLEIRTNNEFKKELNEAIEVCSRILEMLHEMSMLLGKAKSYNNWGEFYSEIQERKRIQKTYMDEAQHLSYHVKQLLGKLKDELQDIRAFKDLSYNKSFEDFKSFNEVYYASLIADWTIQHEITNSILSITKANGRISKIGQGLKKLLMIAETNIDQLNRDKDALILNISK